jgi:transposase
MAARLKAWPDILARRRETVEHPFGTTKQWRAEFRLTALAYNFRRAINILGIGAMMAAVRR